jgi:hypothetical protein
MAANRALDFVGRVSERDMLDAARSFTSARA